jgi:FMN phosphatase YigB (HAD superfamily)
MSTEHPDKTPQPIPPEDPRESSAEEESKSLQERYFVAIEQQLRNEIDQRAPRIPEEERALTPVENERGESVAMVERFRKPEERKIGGKDAGHDLWIIVDFDDVIAHSTSFYRDLHQQIHLQTGIPVETLETIYDAAKLPNEAGKKVLRFSEYIAQVKKRSGKDEAIDAIVAGMDHQRYIDLAVKRALIGARLQSWKAVRLSILTYGDPQYQKFRMDQTDLSDVVDEVIYTEGSKREVIEALLQEVRQRNTPYPEAVPFVVTVDDSPEHVDDYDQLPIERRYANVRFHDPQAKRFGRPHATTHAIVHEETVDSQAAWRLYQLAVLATSQYAQEDRNKVFRMLQNPDAYDAILSRWGGYQRSEGIRYERQGDRLIREGRYFTSVEDRDGQPFIQEVGSVAEDGSMCINPVNPNAVDYREFILDAHS